MDIKKILVICLVLGLFFVGACTKSSTTGYASYNPGGGQQPYVGGGCGVIPDGQYDESAVDVVKSSGLQSA